ncbi:unnamed protein product [Clonostachys rosea]|uniref:Uncharacterized protein n=1 Tax=Bionectria ochroleuca TaxID=29856 RepID=A0ABY6TMN5_BIOOC|nr:unnamed protein product [Clonostachys rosea]
MDDYSARWSALQRGLVDGVIKRGNQDSPSNTIKSCLNAITYQYLHRSRSEDYFIKFSPRHLVYPHLSRQAHHYTRVPLRSRHGFDYKPGKNFGDIHSIITFSDSNTFWSSLPLLSICLTNKFTERYYKKDYSIEQR